MAPRLSPAGYMTTLERMSRLALALAFGIGLLASGCAHEYAYLPVDAAGGGGPAARYPVPPEAPRGEVYVPSLRFMEMDAALGRNAATLDARLLRVDTRPIPRTVHAPAQRLAVAA